MITTIKIMGTMCLRALWKMDGAARVLDALEKVPANDKLVGFLYAKAIIEREVADYRADLAQALTREAASKKVDVAAIKRIGITSEDGDAAMEIEFLEGPEDHGGLL
jgi:hypothetical protein